MADEQKTKRRWGKTRAREKVTIVDRMEIEETLQKFADEMNLRKDCHEVAPSPQKNKLDLQQPELMSDCDLIEALKKIKVPTPVYSDGRASRERLIYLFRQHVLPRPQRQRRLRRRERKLKRAGGGVAEGVSGSGKPREEELDAMEVDDHWAVGSDGKFLIPLERKRKNEVAPSNFSGAPPEKKQSLDGPSISDNLINSTPGSVKSAGKTPSTGRIIKLKRPTRTTPVANS